MRGKLLLALAVTTSLTAPAAAEEWYYVSNSSSEISYGDADSIVRSGNIARLDTFFSHAEKDYHKQTLELNCTGNQFRILTASDYGEGKTYLESPEFEAGWQAFNSKMEFLGAFACEGKYRTTPVADPFMDADTFWYYYYDY